MERKLNINNEYEVTILKQDHFGRGITKINDMFIFVDEGITDDICNIKITSIKKNYATAKITSIITPSKSRVEPLCPYYNACGGCQIMHYTNENKKIFKMQKVKELLEKFTNLKDINIFPIISNNEYNYRNKIILHGDGKNVGFYQEKTHSVIPIKSCMITNKIINNTYKKILSFLEKNNDANIKNLMIRITSSNELMVVLEGNLNQQNFLSILDKDVVVYINNKLVQGNSYILENIFDMKFKIYPDSFFQINYETMLNLYKIVIDYYQNKAYNKVLDLYCGTGTIGMLVSPYVKSVIGVDVVKSSIVSANECKKINKIANIDFIQGKVEDKIESFKDIDSIIVDPPRSGLDMHTIETILKIEPKGITYISCDPVTLARDLKKLINSYNIIQIHPVDMFPNTYHIENVVFLEKK